MKASRKTSSSSSAATTQSNAKKKGAKELQKLEGKAKQATTKMMLENAAGGGKKASKRGSRVRVFKSADDLCEELRSEAMAAHDDRYLLEFHGCFDSVVQVETINNKDHVANVANELVNIDLLLDVFVSQGRSYGKVDGSSYSTVYPCSCQPRDECYGQIKVIAKTTRVYDNGVACQKTSVRVHHN